MTGNTHKKINGYILAGGRSSRMGSDKGLLEFKGKAIIEHVIAQLRPTVNNLVIVANNSNYNVFGYPVICDQIKDAGPAGGIHAALAHSDAESNFIVSCDMPFVTTDAIEYLIEQSHHSQITVPLFKDKLEPLFGIYDTACAPEWQNLIKKNIFKLQLLIDHFKTNTLRVDENSLFNEKLFTNINTKYDLNKALNIAQHGN
ncbi:MAG: molybdenum cofactor guanylyltransferase [bacterium]|nr:molybdenum cofactor guanylyltransferase [bacterium]